MFFLYSAFIKVRDKKNPILLSYYVKVKPSPLFIFFKYNFFLISVMSDEVCKLPPISGECISKQYVNRTYFNQATGKCETFRYRDGCHGNGNNFLTYEACVRGCIPGKVYISK